MKTVLQLAALLMAAQAQTVTYSVYPRSTAAASSAGTGVVYVTRAPLASPSASTSLTGQTTAITSCHYHGETQFCINGQSEEGIVKGAPTNSASAATEYTGCHAHAQETYCLDADGEEFQFEVESSDSTESSNSTSSSSGKNCHFHAGVEHCVGGDEDEEEQSCERTDRDYNIPLRIGLLFVVLVASSIGSFGPMFVKKLFNLSTEGMIFIIIKQFGTGVIIASAFVHLMTHGDLMWQNSCLGNLQYESTGTSLTMAGVLVAFMIEYISTRLIRWRSNKGKNSDVDVDNVERNSEGNSVDKDISKVENNEVPVVSSHGHGHHGHGLLVPKDLITVSLTLMSLAFHSVLLGISLVVSGDSFFITLFVVVLFHQIFEGLALGSRIAELEKTAMTVKLLMAAIYAIVTPIGMAIGIGVISKFNGNDRATLIVLGTMYSFSAGVLIWTGLVEMWAHDWLFGPLTTASPLKTTFAMASLIIGMLLMSVLGKWA